MPIGKIVGVRVEMSRITTRGRATIPQRIREVAGLRPGDVLAFEYSRGELRIRKNPAQPHGSLRPLGEWMHEWSSREDEIAWRDL